MHNPSDPRGADETADLVRSVALSSARLSEEVIGRLGRLEQAQTELAQAVSQLQAGMPALAPAAAGVLAPPPPPAGFAPMLADAPMGTEPITAMHAPG